MCETINTLKEVKMQKKIVFVYKSQNFTQSQKICARETVTFRNFSRTPSWFWQDTGLTKFKYPG